MEMLTKLQTRQIENAALRQRYKAILAEAQKVDEAMASTPSDAALVSLLQKKDTLAKERVELETIHKAAVFALAINPVDLNTLSDEVKARGDKLVKMQNDFLSKTKPKVKDLLACILAADPLWDEIKQFNFKVHQCNDLAPEINWDFVPSFYETKAGALFLFFKEYSDHFLADAP